MIRIEVGPGRSAAWMWAFEQFGNPIYSYNLRWSYNGNNIYYFRDEKDAALFALRWA